VNLNDFIELYIVMLHYGCIVFSRSGPVTSIYVCCFCYCGVVIDEIVF